MSVKVGAATHVGSVRSHNEDHGVVGTVLLSGDEQQYETMLSPPAVLAVMDGMGGHPAGDVASRLVAEGLLDLDPANLSSDDEVEAALHRLDARLAAHMREHRETEAMGTTIVGLVLQGPDHGIAFAAGDSLALWSVPVDDRIGVLFGPDRGPYGGLTQVLGGSRIAQAAGDTLVPHVMHLEGPGRLVLSSDGLTDLIGADTIRPLLTVADPLACADALVGAALEAGGHDNVTVVVLDLEGAAT